MIHPCRTSGLRAWDQVSCYCERALDPGFWAEPLNALTNIAFLVAAVMAYADLRAGRAKGGTGAAVFLILLTMAIGAGSFLFHTLATKWAMLADTIPIALFTFVYLMLALRRLVAVNGIVAFLIAATVTAAGQVMPPWFNGSFAYAPALAATLAVGLVLAGREHPAGRWILSAGGVFAVSLVFRTLDGGSGCLLHPPGAPDPAFIIGTHPIWHILNAVMLYLLLRALIDALAVPNRRFRSGGS